MEYRGIKYNIAQMTSPTAWRWTVIFDSPDLKNKTGVLVNKREAIVRAHNAIDAAVERAEQ
jgi:hypothetical protein